MLHMDIITISSGRKVSLTKTGNILSEKLRTSKKPNELFSAKLLNLVFSEFFDVEKVYFDSVIGKYALKNSGISFKLSGIRNLLINLGVIGFDYRNENILLFDSNYESMLEKIVSSKRSKLSLEKLKEILEHQNKIGEEAELFVLDYENKRLNSVNSKFYAKKISEVDVSAGYDIVSFTNPESNKYDRFIEVKSYTGKINFYWSKNELKSACTKEENYYLYLVDRDKIKNKNYQPVIIRDPYKNVYLNEKHWKKNVTEWHITSDDI
ncbi:DUF3883 domain-containing protein [Sediminibacillus sp. JSM 1682029]|uniref:DUF3883 domain-containing protein n=1 Tax=Sediminibacillus sp. JSM 1682029 TaxID=3229857 RepID=UPI003523749F